MVSEVMRSTAWWGPPWIPGCAQASPARPSGVIMPAAIGRLGMPPGETLIWTMVAQASWPAWPGMPGLHVVVQRELVWMRPQPDVIRFVLALVVDERLDQFLGKDVALHHKAVIVFQATQRFFERCGHRRNVAHLLRRKIVDVLVQRFAGIHLVGGPGGAGQPEGGEGQIRIGRRIRGAEPPPVCFGAGRVHRN